MVFFILALQILVSIMVTAFVAYYLIWEIKIRKRKHIKVRVKSVQEIEMERVKVGNNVTELSHQGTGVIDENIFLTYRCGYPVAVINRGKFDKI